MGRRHKKGQERWFKGSLFDISVRALLLILSKISQQTSVLQYHVLCTKSLYFQRDKEINVKQSSFQGCYHQLAEP